MGCQLNSPSSESDPVEFQSFVSELPLVDLPLSVNCDAESTEPDDTIKQHAFIPANHHLVGRISANKDTSSNLVLYTHNADNMFPCLFTFGPQGEKLDSLCLHDACAQETRIERHSQLKITEDLSVMVLDTSSYFSYMGHGSEYIRSIDSTAISETMFVIGDDGNFEQQDQAR